LAGEKTCPTECSFALLHPKALAENPNNFCYAWPVDRFLHFAASHMAFMKNTFFLKILKYSNTWLIFYLLANIFWGQ